MPPLPTENDLPSPSTVGKALSGFFNFFVILVKEEEYRGLLYAVLGIIFVMVGLAIFIPSTRTSVVTFFVCASVIALLIIFNNGSTNRRHAGKTLPLRRITSLRLDNVACCSASIRFQDQDSFIGQPMEKQSRAGLYKSAALFSVNIIFELVWNIMKKTLSPYNFIDFDFIKI